MVLVTADVLTTWRAAGSCQPGTAAMQLAGGCSPWIGLMTGPLNNRSRPFCYKLASNHICFFASAVVAGREGTCRPPTAPPSVLQRKRQQEQPVPEAAAQLAQHFVAGKAFALSLQLRQLTQGSCSRVYLHIALLLWGPIKVALVIPCCSLGSQGALYDHAE